MNAEWSGFPGVRRTLERWGLLPPDSPRSAVPDEPVEIVVPMPPQPSR
ncbi:MAG: hypothetical protein ACREK6_13680 [Candidatus Rokuibacteriota bacterium]